MLRYITLTFFVTLCIFSCKKDLLQVQKVQQLTSNTTGRLNHIRFITDSICIVSGGEKFLHADVLISRDGGNTWTIMSFTNDIGSMYGMGISPSGSIYLSGFGGHVLYSADTGKSWQQSQIGDGLYYVGASFPTPDTGVFVSTITEKQGTITQVDASLNILTEKTFLFGLNDIYMLSPSTGYVIGYGAVMKTTDNRRSWVFQDVEGDNFTAMDIHGSEIWMCGYNGGIYHTYNGGEKWTKFRNGNDVTQAHYHLNSILFKDNQNGWAVGENGVVLHSDDGGHHWMEYDHFTNSNLLSVALSADGHLFVIGENGSIYKLTI